MGIFYKKWVRKLIDTIKIVSMINKNTYDKISNNSIIKTAYNLSSGEIFYKIINDKLEGSYSSSLSVRVGEGAKYNFINAYYIEIEGSFHKIKRGYNSHNGFYNIVDISIQLINLVNNCYNIKLPSIKHWFLQRVDIAICYDLEINKNVQSYINSLSLCNYPRRNLKFYQDESIYLTGTTTTLKIYNKLLEFKKHDMKKLIDENFCLSNYLINIDGLIRFECEIKKKKLTDFYNKKYVRILNTNYDDFKNIWSDEFMKLLKIFDSDLMKVKSKKEVERRLKTIYPNKDDEYCMSKKASTLYNFYLSIMVDGLRNVKARTKKSTYYRNIKELKNANIDFSQNMDLDFNEIVFKFNPFEYEEVV